MNISGITLTVSLKKANDGRKSYEKPLNYNMIHRMLRNRKYIGEYKFSDVVVPGGVTAIVDILGEIGSSLFTCCKGNIWFKR